MLTRAQTKSNQGLVQKLQVMMSGSKDLTYSKNLNFQSVSTKQESSYRTGAFTTHENSTWVNDRYNDADQSSSANDCPGTPISFSSGLKMVNMTTKPLEKLSEPKQVSEFKTVNHQKVNRLLKKRTFLQAFSKPGKFEPISLKISAKAKNDENSA